MMYFFDFSPPADVFASKPACAAISRKLILGGAGRASLDSVCSFLCRTVVGIVRNRVIRVSATTERRMMVSLYALRGYLKVPFHCFLGVLVAQCPATFDNERCASWLFLLRRVGSPRPQ